jgi:hypothetical protein
MNGDFEKFKKIKTLNKKTVNDIESIEILSRIIANRIIEKLEKDEQLGITASGDDCQICEKSKAA